MTLSLRIGILLLYKQLTLCEYPEQRFFMGSVWGEPPERRRVFVFHRTTVLDPESHVPLYEQLYRSLTAELRAGAVPAGTRMPEIGRAHV